MRRYERGAFLGSTPSRKVVPRGQNIATTSHYCTSHDAPRQAKNSNSIPHTPNSARSSTPPSSETYTDGFRRLPSAPYHSLRGASFAPFDVLSWMVADLAMVTPVMSTSGTDDHTTMSSAIPAPEPCNDHDPYTVPGKPLTLQGRRSSLALLLDTWTNNQRAIANVVIKASSKRRGRGSVARPPAANFPKTPATNRFRVAVSTVLGALRFQKGALRYHAVTVTMEKLIQIREAALRVAAIMSFGGAVRYDRSDVYRKRRLSLLNDFGQRSSDSIRVSTLVPHNNDGPHSSSMKVGRHTPNRPRGPDSVETASYAVRLDRGGSASLRSVGTSSVAAHTLAKCYVDACVNLNLPVNRSVRRTLVLFEERQNKTRHPLSASLTNNASGALRAELPPRSGSLRASNVRPQSASGAATINNSDGGMFLERSQLATGVADDDGLCCDFSQTLCGPNGALPIILTLEMVPLLKRLSFSECGITDATTVQLCSVLEHSCPKLADLDLSRNPRIGFLGGSAVYNLLQSCRKLCVVNLDGTNVRGSTARSIARRLRQRNASLMAADDIGAAADGGSWIPAQGTSVANKLSPGNILISTTQSTPHSLLRTYAHGELLLDGIESSDNELENEDVL